MFTNSLISYSEMASNFCNGMYRYPNNLINELIKIARAGKMVIFSCVMADKSNLHNFRNRLHFKIHTSELYFNQQIELSFKIDVHIKIFMSKLPFVVKCIGQSYRYRI